MSKKKRKRAPGAGRPPKFGNQKTVTLSKRVPESHAADVDAIFELELSKDKYKTPKREVHRLYHTSKTNAMINTNWIKCSDRLPEKVPNSNGGCSETVLIWINSPERIEYKDQPEFAYYTSDGWYHRHGDLLFGTDRDFITHWQPLPDVPDAKKDDAFKRKLGRIFYDLAEGKIGVVDAYERYDAILIEPLPGAPNVKE